jgi:pimeloyl-ACP methyl ester carboxylesterase
MNTNSQKSGCGGGPAANGEKTADRQPAPHGLAYDRNDDEVEGWGEYADAFHQDLTDIANHFRDVLPLLRGFGWSRREETELRMKVRHLAALMRDIEAALAPGQQPMVGAVHNKHDAKTALAAALAMARPALNWAEIRELVFAAELKTKGAKVEEI